MGEGTESPTPAKPWSQQGSLVWSFLDFQSPFLLVPTMQNWVLLRAHQERRVLGMEPNISSQPWLIPQSGRCLIVSGICPVPLPVPREGLLYPSFTAKSKKTWETHEGGAQAAPGWPCVCEGSSLREVEHPQGSEKKMCMLATP